MRDEAADTPLWMPVLGLCILLLGAFAVIWQAAAADEEPVLEADATAEAAPAEPADEPAGDEPAEAPPAPADPHAGHGH